MPGPLQIIAVSLGPGVSLQRQVLAEVDRLQGRGVLRLLDLLFVAKNEDDAIQRLVAAEDDDFGALLSGIVPLDGADLPEPAADNGSPGFDLADARALAESLPPGTTMAFLLIEHSWAQPLFDAIAETGGALLGEGFLTSDAGLLVGAEVAAMEQAAQVIAAAQAAEAREALRAAAAAGAVRALINAGLVEEAAAHEAAEALKAAGLIVAAADEVAADAVADDAAEVRAADEVAAEAVAEDAATIRAASITLAEARVLRYLPTPLTFALIAGKLGISRSAAKERAERAYKKLGVHSRAEAVSRARELGLIR